MRTKATAIGVALAAVAVLCAMFASHRERGTGMEVRKEHHWKVKKTSWVEPVESSMTVPGPYHQM